LPELVLVGPVPPPSGGVATHVSDLQVALRRRGVACRVVPDRRTSVLGELWPSRGALAHAHVCGHNSASYALCGLLAARPGSTIVTLHSGLAPLWLARLSAARRRAVRAILGRLAAVVCVSEAVAKAARALDVADDAIVVSPAFIAESVAPAAPPRAVAALPGRVLACAVAPGSEYGADVLVDGFAIAAALEPDLRLCVYGPGSADRDVAGVLRRLGVGDRVHALGELRRADALGVVTACDAFLRPTRADGDAVSVREALALGRRVVASDASVRPDGCLLFRAGDAAALASAIRAALAAPPPPSARLDGLTPLLDLYRRWGVDLPREASCAESPAA
jgi:glycogen synthase